MKLPAQGIAAALTGAGKSAARRELGPAASMEGSGLGFAAGNGDRPGVDKERGEGREKGRHGMRGLPARGAAHEDGRRRATRAAARGGKQREEEEEADRWGPAGIFIFFSFFFPGL